MIDLIQGDCLEKLKGLADNSVDSVVTDPPAGISFMGKTWDGDKGGRDHWIAWKCEIAKECLRVLKPGGHALVWALPRTAHWTTTAWENAGFEVRDVIAHLFGSGFSKSHNIGKSIDKLQGNEREVVGTEKIDIGIQGGSMHAGRKTNVIDRDLTKGNSPYEGWGTALKPAREDYILLRKPFKGTVASNVLEWGTGGINIDGCRVGTEILTKSNDNVALQKWKEKDGRPHKEVVKNAPEKVIGRFPANIIHDGSDEVLAVFPESKSTGGTGKISLNSPVNTGGGNNYTNFGDQGSSSRFFYCAKPSKSERNAGLEGFATKTGSELTGRKEGSKGMPGSLEHGNSTNPFANSGSVQPRSNFHPTVKAIKLMTYLCKLITPVNGTILDPFMGSGSTGVAAVTEGFGFIGIELDPEYFQIAKARIENVNVLL